MLFGCDHVLYCCAVLPQKLVDEIAEETHISMEFIQNEKTLC